jgi:hypothetical protein
MLTYTPSTETRRFLNSLRSPPSGQVPPRFLLGGTFLDLLAETCPPPDKLATLEARSLL